jgi:L-ribulose-5-phosphate 4-epimerase
MLESLKESVCQANKELKKQELIIYSWGNVSGIDPDRQYVAIKPSGVDYEKLTANDIVITDIEGNIIEGNLRPSSDLKTHLEIYKNFSQTGGVVHTHSPMATCFAQAIKAVPCLGTTHADHFCGDVPVTDPLQAAIVQGDYEANTGHEIIRTFTKRGLDPAQIPAVLVANHGPFTWGETPAKAVENSVVLEEVAKMAAQTLTLNPQINSIAEFLLHKHYFRKHGKNAYYGQQ